MSKMFFPQAARRALPIGPAPRAVVLDDDPDQCMNLLLYLSQVGFSVVIAHNLADALSVIERDAPRLAVLRRRRNLPEGSGAVLAKTISPDLQIIETADREESILAGDGVPLLARPVSIASFDQALTSLGVV